MGCVFRETVISEPQRL